MKTPIILVFITCGLLAGFSEIAVGRRKRKQDGSSFNLSGFLKKSSRKTPLNKFTGAELISLGIITILATCIVFILCI